MQRDVPPPPPPPGANRRDVPPPPPPGANAMLTKAAAVEQDDGGVQMVRIEQPERVYDRVAVLGRDAESVFPSLAQANADKVVSATQAVVGSMSFVTETELQEIKAKRGGALRPEDGTMEVEKSLWAVLQEAKDAKEAEFAEGWKTMKQGKNKPLDEEEVDFLDDVEVQKREDDKKRLEREKDDIECFKLMRETMVVKSAPARAAVGAAGVGGLGGAGGAGAKRGAGGDAGGAGVGAKKPKPAMTIKPKIVPKFKAVPKKAPDEKKKEEKEKEEEEEDDDEGGGLGGLLGYGSGSEED